jgi:hypothetical protein
VSSSDNTKPAEAERAGPDPDEHKAPVTRLIDTMAGLGIALLDASELANLLPDGARPPELARLRESNRVVAVRWRGRWRYPSFQFSSSGHVLPRIVELVRDVGSGVPGWIVLGWLVHQQPLLGKRPIEYLASSETEWDRVRQAARDRFDESTGFE